MANQTSKSPKLADNYKLWVKVEIIKAEDIDKETSNPVNRFYSAFAWTGPNTSIQTKIVHGSPDPFWNTSFFISLEQLVCFGHMGFEIYRSSYVDPSPSTCKVLVGRTLIPFQKEDDFNKQATYELLVPEGPEWMAGGSITIVTEVNKVYD